MLFNLSCIRGLDHNAHVLQCVAECCRVGKMCCSTFLLFEDQIKMRMLIIEYKR